MKKEEFKDLIKYGQKNEENKIKVINIALNIICILNDNKKLTKEDMGKISGGNCYTFILKYIK